MRIRNMLVSRNVRIICLATLVFSSGLIFDHTGDGNNRLWYLALLLNLILLVATARWISRKDD